MSKVPTFCDTGKVCHSREKAREVLRKCRQKRSKGQSHRQEQKAYECRVCGAWHLCSG